MSVYNENPKESIKMLLEILNDSNMNTVYKGNIKMSIIFLYSGNDNLKLKKQYNLQ